jgi:SAM-dependent methyltransferase
MSLDMEKLKSLAFRMLDEVGAAASGALVLLGDRLGLYQALVDHGPVTSEALAAKLGLHERYLREWLHAQAVSKYIDYDAATETFSICPEQAMVLANPESPVSMAGGFWGISALYAVEPKIAEAFKTGAGLPWGEHSTCLFCGTARFFGPGYRANLIEQWIPALEGVKEKLERGARVADVGCGHALTTRLMAKAFPNSQFVGIDVHQPSIDHAAEIAREEGLTNICFEQGSAQQFNGRDYDLVTLFDCLHDMGDPEGAVRAVAERLAPDGTLMVVEPQAGDSLSENMNPVSRAFLSFSTMVCVPASLSQPGRAALGAQAGEKKLTAVIQAGGFNHVRRACDSSTNMILEARRQA